MIDRFLLFVIVHAFATYLVHRQGRSFYQGRSEKCERPKVYDIGHRVLPDLSRSRLANVANDVMASVPFVLAYAWNMPDYYRLFATVLAIRWITTLVTILPKHKHCDDAAALAPSNYLFGHCYDKVFSGHFAASLLLAMMLYRSGQFPTWALVAYEVVHALLIVSVRSHYTIDLMVSAFVVMTVLAR